MIKVICPHCKNKLVIADDVIIYNLNRIGKSLYKCDYCTKTLYIFYDGDDIVVIRTGNK